MKRQFFVLEPIDQHKEHIGTKTHRKDVNGCVDIPSKPLGELFENNDGGITRPYKEHIHLLSQNKLDERVEQECDTAQSNEGKGRAPVVRFLIPATFRKTEKQPYKDKKHMPDAGVEGQEPVSV